MQKILITRFGGLGDLIMLEPTIEALYYKHFPCEITIRTYKDYVDVFKFHPLVKETILDDNSYSVPLIDIFDYSYDFQGVIEKHFGIHGVDAFASHAQVPLLRKTPSVFIDPSVFLEEHEVVLQLTSYDKDRTLEIDLAGYKIPKNLPIHEYFKMIEKCRVFVGVDSSGLHIASALGVPQIVGIYNPKYPASIRSYPRVLTTLMDDIGDIRQKFSIAINTETYPDYLNQGNAKQRIQCKALEFCKGTGFDIGADQWPLDGAIPIRENNRKDLRVSVDYIFSSHCLEHIENWKEELQLYSKLIIKGGHLFLYLPHPRMEQWQPGSAWVGNWHKWSPDPILLVKYLMENTTFKVIEYTSHPDMHWSFYIVAKNN